jgi:AcrR family transcriptional regulator
MNIVTRTIGAHHRKLAAAHGPRLTADERRTEVIEAAVAAFGVGGLAGTSTEAVARLAGVSQPYLFRLFGTKQELFLAAVGRTFERISLAFEEAARRPAPDAPPGHNAILMSMGRAYGDLLADRSLLRLQLHSFAACDDPVVQEFVRRHFADLVTRVAQLSGVSSLELRTFFAEGMLLNVAAAMDLREADMAWERICQGGEA